MKVKVLRAFWYGGELKSIGAEVELPDPLGREVVYGGKGALVKDQKPAPAPTPTKQPITTKSAAALTGKGA